jgi:hypothetical protein
MNEAQIVRYTRWLAPTRGLPFDSKGPQRHQARSS